MNPFIHPKRLAFVSVSAVILAFYIFWDQFQEYSRKYPNDKTIVNCLVFFTMFIMVLLQNPDKTFRRQQRQQRKGYQPMESEDEIKIPV